MEIINHECYVSLEVAKLLKELGFNWEVKTYYRYLSPYDEYNFEFDSISTNYNHLNNADFSAPSLAVAQRWLREVKGIETYAHVFYDSYDMLDEWDVYVYEVNHITKHTEDYILSYDIYHTHEEAQEAGIKKVLEMILMEGE